MSLLVNHLRKRYGQKIVVDDLSFSMEKPGVYALLGTNGAGKTTSIRMMLGMLSRDGGEVLWNGQPLDTDKCNVGYLAEERGLYPKYALMDQLLYIAAQGITVLSEKEYEYRLRVTGEQQANALLGSLIADGISIVTFDLREPSLHEIFVETVGGEADEDA